MKYYDFSIFSEPEFVVPIRTEEQGEPHLDDKHEIVAGIDDFENTNSKEARIVIIATAIVCGLLILVITAILGT